MNKPNNRLVDTENKLVVARWEEGWGKKKELKGIRSTTAAAAAKSL